MVERGRGHSRSVPTRHASDSHANGRLGIPPKERPDGTSAKAPLDTFPRPMRWRLGIKGGVRSDQGIRQV